MVQEKSRANIIIRRYSKGIWEWKVRKEESECMLAEVEGTTSYVRKASL